MENTLIIVGYVNNQGLFREETIKVAMKADLTVDQKTSLAVSIVETELCIEDYNYVLHTELH